MSAFNFRRLSFCAPKMDCCKMSHSVLLFTAENYFLFANHFVRHFMFHHSFKELFWREFSSIREGSEYFHVNVATVRRWLDGTVAINPMAEKLLLIKALGYLPNDIRWRGFRIDEARGVFITPESREFSPKELDSFVHWRDEHRQLVELHGRIDNPIKQPAKDNLLPFRGGRRMKSAPWIPSKHKFK